MEKYGIGGKGDPNRSTTSLSNNASGGKRSTGGSPVKARESLM